MPRDELVYHDGDRVRGRLLRKEGETYVFQADRFGLLHVPIEEAQVILAPRPPTVAAPAGTEVAPAPAPAAPPAPRTPAPAPAPTGPMPATVTEEEFPTWREWLPYHLSPREMTLALRRFFGPWHGRFSFATEVVSDTTERNNFVIEGKLRRKWTNDEFQLNGRYDFSRTEETTTLDMVKADAYYRHDFRNRFFGLYRPTVEWNRAYFRDGAPADYVLLQQEIGVGYNVLKDDRRTLRVGVSENLFNVWVLPTDQEIAQGVESIFVEAELRLPWRVTLRDRGVWYYSFENHDDGWENRFELDKMLTETLSAGIRYEVRYNNPDVRSQDYRLLRLMVGFDF